MDARTTSPAGAGAAPARGAVLLALLSVAQLMVILDISAVNVALPEMARDLRIAEEDLSWTITSYSLIFGSMLLLGGRAADLLGRRRVFLGGLIVFTVASLLSAVADSPMTLFAARAGQGLGAAMLSPAALSIITSTFVEGRERARALAVWGAVGGAGAAIGVLLGGALTEWMGWRSIFFVNLPVGVVLAAAATRVLPLDVAPPRWRGLDVRGGALATLGLGTLVFALSRAEVSGWGSLQTIGFGAAGLTGLAAFAVLEVRTPEPLLRVERLADRAVGGGFVTMLAASAVLFGSFLLASLYLQNVLGAGALETGLAFVPFAAAIAGGVHIGSHLTSKVGVRVPLSAGFALGALGMVLLSAVAVDGTYAAAVLPGMLVAGVGLGIILVSVSVAVLTGGREDESGMLSGLNTTGHEIGGAIGVAVLATIATADLGGEHGPAAAATLTAGIGDAFLVSAIIAAVAAAASLIVLPPARSFLPRLRLAPRVSVH